MEIRKQPTSVTITFSPANYWLRKSDDEFNGEYMLTYRIDMSYKGKEDQEGGTCLYLTAAQAETFREAGFDEII